MTDVSSGEAAWPSYPITTWAPAMPAQALGLADFATTIDCRLRTISGVVNGNHTLPELRRHWNRAASP